MYDIFSDNYRRVGASNNTHLGNLVVLFTIGVAVTLYARYICNFPICQEDEQRYTEILNQLAQGKEWPVSGMGFVHFLQILHKLIGLSFENLVPKFAIILSTIIPVVLYLIYRDTIKDDHLSFYATLLLFTSSYFISPMIIGRPQQLGMILVLIGALRFQKDLNNNHGPTFSFFIIYLFTFYYHLLSFILLNAAITGYFFMTYIHGKARLQYMVKPCLTLGVTIFSMFYSPLYATMLKDIQDFHLQGIRFSVLMLELVIFFIILAFFAKFARRHCAALYQLFIENSRACRASIVYFLVASVIFAAVMQYIIAPPEYTVVYNRSIGNFVLFQSGNLAFGVLFFFGLHAELQRRSHVPFFLYSLIFIFIGGWLLLFSLKLGDKNWMIRTINYWCLFASPIAASNLLKLSRSTLFIIFLGITIFSIISSLHTIKDQRFFLCSETRDAVKLSVLEPSSVASPRPSGWGN